MASREEEQVLTAIEFPRSLAEIWETTAIPERRCRALLQSLKLRGFARLTGRRWEATPKGRKYRVELGKTLKAPAQSQVGSTANPPALTFQEQYELYLAEQDLEGRVSDAKDNIMGVLQNLEGAIAKCKEIPLAAKYLRLLQRKQGRLQFLLDRLKEVRDEGQLEELDELAAIQVTTEVEELIAEVLTRMKGLGLFEIIQKGQDEPDKIRCTACGFVQDDWRDGPGYPAECGNCGRKGETFLPKWPFQPS